MNRIFSYIKYHFFAVIFLIITLSCEEQKDYPALGSVNLSSISNSAFLATVDVERLGDYGITDHGFVYGTYTENPGSGYAGPYKKSLGKLIENDTFSAVLIPDVNSYYSDGLKCYVRAYITDERGTMFSDIASIPVLRLRAFNITPLFARPGDTMTIAGSNFNTDLSMNTVTFNNIQGEMVSATSNEIRVILPSGIQENYWSNAVTIRITSGIQTFELDNDFRLAPDPVSFSPSSGLWGQTITVYGSGFQGCKVYFDSQEIPLSGYDNNSIYFTIPWDLISKRFKIYIKYEGESYEVPGGYFTMKELNMSSPEKTRYYPGESINLYGSGFHPMSQENTLFIGPYEIESHYAYSYLGFEIPVQIPSGTYSLKVSNSIDTVNIDGTISIIRPVISEVSVNAGYPGSEVIITGIDLTSDSFSPSVSLHPYSFSPVMLNSSQIVFNVPMIPAGEYTLFAWYGFAVEAPEKFTVLEPVVTSIVPSEGSPGTSVIINGQGFVNLYDNRVYFGNISTPIMSVTNTQINVLVPDSLSPGNWMVQVYMSGQRLSTTVSFNVH